jgi:hypothetical protein
MLSSAPCACSETHLSSTVWFCPKRVPRPYPADAIDEEAMLKGTLLLARLPWLSTNPSSEAALLYTDGAPTRGEPTPPVLNGTNAALP